MFFSMGIVPYILNNNIKWSLYRRCIEMLGMAQNVKNKVYKAVPNTCITYTSQHSIIN